MKGDEKKKRGDEGKEGFFFFSLSPSSSSYRLLNLSDKEPRFSGAALEAG